MPLHGQSLTPSAHCSSLRSPGIGCFLLGFGFGFPKKRLDPRTLTLGKEETALALEASRRKSELQGPREGQSRGGAPTPSGRAHFSPKSRQYTSTQTISWGNVNSPVAVLFSGHEPLDKFLIYEQGAFLVRKTTSQSEE